MFKRLRLLAALVLFGLPSVALAGHEFTQGSTNTPVWLQAGQGVFAEQYYSGEYQSTAGEFTSIYFGPNYDSNYNEIVPTGADGSTSAWKDFDAGDVMKIEIGTFSLTLAFDAANGTCAYDICGWTGNSFVPDPNTGYTTSPDFFGGWGATILPAITGIDTNTSGTLSLAELQAASSSAYGSMKYFLGTDIGLVAYNWGDPGVTLDADTSGTLSAAEITAFNSTTYGQNPILGGASGSTLVSNFATYDLDSSGALSQAELNAALLALQFAAIDTDTSGDVSAAEMFQFVWEKSENTFHYNSNGSEGMFNQFGTTFTAVAGQFSLFSYRLTDGNGYRLHGAGSGPIDQSSVCTPPNCGPGASSGPSDVGTAIAVIEQHRVEREAMRQAERVLVGVSELQVDVNFNSGSGESKTTASSQGSGAAAGFYRWAARADGALSNNADMGNTKTGSLVLAYGLKPDLDVGLYTAMRGIDLSLNGNGFDGTMNAYGVYLRKRDDSGVGLQWKASLATTRGSATLSRGENTDGADAAFGTANLTGSAASAELGYGMKVKGFTVTSFARLSYSSMTRGAYAEDAATAAPISYDAFTQTSTTITVGASGETEINDTDALFGSVYAVSDLNRSNSGLSGTSTIVNMTDFDIASSDQLNPVRIGADVTYYHEITANSRIYGGLSAQKEADVAAPTLSLNFGFEARY